MAETKTASANVGIFGWLFLILFVLKLNPGGHLDSPVQDWSWWWVTAPLWGGFVLAAVFIAIFAVVLKRINKNSTTNLQNYQKRFNGR